MASRCLENKIPGVCVGGVGRRGEPKQGVGETRGEEGERKDGGAAAGSSGIGDDAGERAVKEILLVFMLFDSPRGLFISTVFVDVLAFFTFIF